MSQLKYSLHLRAKSLFDDYVFATFVRKNAHRAAWAKYLGRVFLPKVTWRFAPYVLDNFFLLIS